MGADRAHIGSMDQPTRGFPPSSAADARLASPQWSHGRFRNKVAAPPTVSRENRTTLWDFFFNKPKDTVPHGTIPVQAITRAELDAAPDHSLWRLGHSTVLMKLGGAFFLTDPVFSKRASPVQWFGPRRFHAPPISINDLPPIRAVILSHDHYDHLDKAAIRKLAPKVQDFVTTLGVGQRLIRWGVPAEKVHEFDWWQETAIDDVTLVCTPAQHFSGRGLRDGNSTLWCSWVIAHGDRKIFFSGDGGYFDGFREIGRRHGPFDLSLMEDGAYNAAWPYVHMAPEQSVQAHVDLGAKVMLPIHNGTFDLSMHAWFDPFERVTALARQHGVRLATPRIGQRIDIGDPPPSETWWRGIDER